MMWEKPDFCTAVGTSRPIRVAYLVDLLHCPDMLLDRLFAESYGRWGGRRTAIIPTTAEGIDERYARWFREFDADIIYSFVQLSDRAVEDTHERFAPSVLLKHETFRVAPNTPDAYRVALPLEALSSLSVIPTFLSRPGPLSPPTARLQTLDSEYPGDTRFAFLEENFGLFGSSYPNGLIMRYSDILAPVTLISEGQRDDPHMHRNPHADYVIGEAQVLDVLAERRRPLVTLSNLSEMYAPYLTGHSTHQHEGLTIVVGDTPADRLAFWNGIHRKDRSRPYEIQQLRLSTAAFEDAAFLAALRRIMSIRGAYGSANRNDAIGLESCSLNREQLNELGGRLREAGNFLTVSARALADPSEVIPLFDHHSSARFSTGGFMEEPVAKASTQFRGRHLLVPIAPPWHLSEAMPPQPMRGGAWMVDMMLEREVDHSPSSNVRHVWMLPRRIRIERAFALEAEGYDRIGNPPGLVRPNVCGNFTFATNLTQRPPMLALPEDDITAIRAGVQNDFEWREFERQRKPPKYGRERFHNSAISDKGRYLLGVLQLFEEVPNAFATLMEGFWHDEFQVLGAGLLEKRPDLATRVVSTIRNRLGQKTGPVTFQTETEFARLGEVALRAAAELRAETPARNYGELAADWKQSVEEWLKRDGTPKVQGRMAVVEGPADDADEERKELSDPAQYLDPAIEYLCERQVLFQGYHWTCQTCFNKNWSGVEGLGRSMECSVCRTARPVPVSDQWDFRANGFLIDAYRFHGVEAVIWAMWTLFRLARSSFYFSPSLTLWKAYPKEGRPKKPDAEVDAIVIADGVVYAIEATRSKGLSPDEIGKLKMIAELVRPNVLYVAAGEQPADDLKALQANLQKQMPSGVEAQVVAFDPKALSRAPYLWGAS